MSIFKYYIPQNNWKEIFTNEINKDYFKKIEEKYKKSCENNIVYPSIENTFKAFELTDLNNIKVIILGMDPYPGECRKTKIPYANGLAFSVNKKCSIPSSLKNIYKELEHEGYDIENRDGDLTNWANQGILLINTQLSVVKNKPNTHKFWNKFTDNILKYILDKNDNIKLLLLGGNALNKIKKLKLEDYKNKIITSHPSPLSYKRKLKEYPPFFQSNVFNKINELLKNENFDVISW